MESDPKAALAEIGGEVPDGVEVRVARDTDAVKYLHIPSPPPQGEISDADLVGAQGGSTPLCVISGSGLSGLTLYSLVTVSMESVQ